MVLEDDVVQRFKQAGCTLAFAESLTGGLVAARLTRVPGAGDVLRGSIVTYMDGAKRDLLGVDAALLEREGAVCAPVAAQMAEGARRALRADVSVSLTGIAGPDAPRGLPIGIVFLSVATKAGTTTVERRFTGGREAIREAAAREALEMALAALDAIVPP